MKIPLYLLGIVVGGSILNAQSTTGIVSSIEIEPAFGVISFGDSVTGLNGTNNSVTGAQDEVGNIGQAGEFDGSAYLEYPSHANYNFATGPFTVAFIIRIDPSATGEMTIVAKRQEGSPWRQYSIRYLASGRFSFGLYAGTESLVVTDDPVPNNGDWVHVVCIRKGNGSKEIYIDGGLAGSAPLQGSLRDISNSDKLVIGRHGTTNTRYLKGKLDDVRMYNRAISADEVYRLYAFGIVSGILHGDIDQDGDVDRDDLDDLRFQRNNKKIELDKINEVIDIWIDLFSDQL